MDSILLNIQGALRSLAEHRTRAALSALGIMVGSLAIVLLISIAKGVRADISREVADLGVNLLVVMPARIEEGSMFTPNLAGVSYLRDEHIARVRQVPGVRAAAPVMFVGGGIQSGGRASPSTMILAVGADWFQVHPVTMAEGRPFSRSQERQDVAVIGSIARKNLFGSDAALGRRIDINGRKYTVVGVTEDQRSGSSLFSMASFENAAYIPYERARSTVPSPQLHRIMVQTAADVEPRSLVQSVDSALGETLERAQYSVLTQEDLLGLVYKLMGILTWLLTGLTSIALFVGGIGIMTVMLMSVNERSKEIGIRKTVGARRRDVFVQFLTEAIVLALTGGAAGFALSYLACLALYTWTPVKPMVTYDTVLLGFGVSLVVGCVFGLLPALNAARKDPVSALRSE